MKLLIMQRVFAWSDTYDVYDQWEQPCYYVRGETLTWGHQIHVVDRRCDQEVASIHQKLLTLMPRFDLVVGGQLVGDIRRQFNLVRHRYALGVQGWRVEGDVFGLDYNVLDRSDRVVMHLSKQLLHWGDTYVLDIPDPADALLCLLVSIAIDAANCGN